jgi:hypothetical protein
MSTNWEAIINVPGYLPMDDDQHVFETARDAWQYLIDERARDCDDWEDPEGCGCLDPLHAARSGEGAGVVYLPTPGSDSDHDLGLAYSVVELGDQVTCGHCGRSWWDKITPTPSARCPYEYEHEYEDQGDIVDHEHSYAAGGGKIMCALCGCEPTHLFGRQIK